MSQMQTTPDTPTNQPMLQQGPMMQQAAPMVYQPMNAQPYYQPPMAQPMYQAPINVPAGQYQYVPPPRRNNYLAFIICVVIFVVVALAGVLPIFI